RTRHGEAIERSNRESHEALQSYLGARTQAERDRALSQLRTAAERLPEVRGARNVFGDMHGRAQAHDAETRVQQAANADAAVAGLERLRAIQGATPSARDALLRLAPDGVDRTLAALRGSDPAVRDRALSDLRHSANPQAHLDDLRAMGSNDVA